MLGEQTVRDALKVVYDPELQKSLLELGMIRDIAIKRGRVSLTLALTTSRCPKKEAFVEEIRRVLEKLGGVSEVEVAQTTLSQEEMHQLFPRHPLTGIGKVRQVFAVASGKGGVGKTTIAVNLALALARKGNRVGLMDADIYGPSIPVMLGLEAEAEREHGIFLPVEKFGLKIMSLGMLIEKGHAVIWRGPMVAKAIQQLLVEVLWGELDYLVVDLPPGTGDASISVAQSIPGASVLMVTTPQEVALADVRRSIELFRKFNVHLAGLVENMSYFICGHTSDPIEIFGHGGGEKLCGEFGLPLLGLIPIDLELGKGGDTGEPLMVSKPDSETGRIFQNIAGKLLAETVGGS